MIKKLICLALLCPMLSACWSSDRDLFTQFDKVALNPEASGYTLSAGNERVPATLVFASDNKVNVRYNDPEDKPESDILVFVETYADDDYQYYIGFEDDASSNEDEVLYFVARGNEYTLDIYYPNCSGTPDITAMERSEGKCTFLSQEAALEAGKKAAQFLQNPIIITAPAFSINAIDGQQTD